MSDFDNLTPAQIEAIQWGNLARKMVTDKKTKGAFEKLVKQVAPEVETSEDLAEPLLAPLREQLNAQAQELQGIRDGAAEWNKKEKRDALRKAGYTDEAIGKIEEISQSRGIKDLMDAAAVFDKTIPAPRPSIGGVSSQNFGNDLFGLQGENTKETLDLLFNDPDAFIAQQVNAVADEYRNQE